MQQQSPLALGCPLANNVENIDCRQVWTCPGVTPKSAPSRGGSGLHLVAPWAPRSPHHKRHLDQLYRFVWLEVVSNRQTDRQTDDETEGQ